MAMKPPKPIELDGRTGEGGGQLVRIAVALAAVTSQPVHITNVRGNREGPRGGGAFSLSSSLVSPFQSSTQSSVHFFPVLTPPGLKSQHVTSIEWLAEATDASVVGLSVGSKTLTFQPRLGPATATLPKEQPIRIAAASPAASALLILQATLPFLLFAGGNDGEPIDVEIAGGTNVSFSLSYEYLDQVLLPTLEAWFGVRVERALKSRGWSAGPTSRGTVRLAVHPLRRGQALSPSLPADLGSRPDDFDIERVAASVVVPGELQASVTRALARDVAALFGDDVALEFPVLEDSGHEARIYVLLVAHARSGRLRWGRDHLFAQKRKGRSAALLADLVSRAVCRDLYGEVRRRGVVDEYLQDQLVVFQALAKGRTAIPRPEEEEEAEGASEDQEGLADAMDRLSLFVRGEGELRKDKLGEPFGQGSSHTTTCRWVTGEMLPAVKWFGKGKVCEGVGLEAAGESIGVEGEKKAASSS